MEVEELSKQVLQDRAATLLALHVPGNPAILPTVWTRGLPNWPSRQGLPH